MAETLAPKVTVLMPVYNGGRYLQDAIESILAQTFTDFEFLIINDGSTDDSVSIIESFKDKRIRLVNNERNLGLVDTLNKGIDLALGEYIARMDCDDISLPERLQKQMDEMVKDKSISLVASHYSMIDEEGKNTGQWPPEVRFKTSEEIYKALPKDNWIPHPSVLIRTEVIRKYRYIKYKKGAEDWDLWLRMASDGRVFHKVNEVLLRYRIHKTSFTTVRNENGPYINKCRVLFKYCIFKIKEVKFNSFDFRVLISFFSNYFKHLLWLINPNFPVMFGKISVKVIIQFWRVIFSKMDSNTSIFLFIPSYRRIENNDIYFPELLTRKGLMVFITEAENNCRNNNHNMLNISEIGSIPYISNLVKRMISKRIRKAEKPIVIGYDSAFFYRLLVYLNAGTDCRDIIKRNMDVNKYNRELVYNYGTWSIPYAERLSKRIAIGKETFEEIKDAYLSNSKNPLLDRIEYIDDSNNAEKIIFD